MSGLYRFGEFRLDPARRLLSRGDEALTLAPKAFDMLLVLIENRSRVLSKEELLRILWPDTFVEEGNLKFNVSVIRKVLGDEPWIETLPRRGYRFAGQVEEIGAEQAASGNSSTEIIAAGAGDRTEVTVSLEAELKPSPKVWRMVALVALVVAVGSGVFWWLSRPRVVIRSMAVLPFQSIAANGPDREMELGLADSLIGRLGQQGHWLVRPTAAVRDYAGVNRDPVAAGRSLQVDAVLDGSIQREAGRVRLTLQMLRVSDGRQLWTAKFDQKLTDLFSLEDQIAVEVARALEAKPPRPSSANSHSASPEVYELYLAGRHYFYQEKAPTRQAIQNFELALERDPGFAPAHAMLALAYWQLTQRGVAPPQDVRDKMRASALKAIELDESLAEGHVALALARMWLDYDWEGSATEYKRALQLNPNEPLVYVSWGLHAMATGRFDEAEKAYRQKLEIDPRSLMSIEGMGYPFAYRRQYDEALVWYRKALEVDANFPLAYTDIGAVYHLKGMHREGVQATLKAAALSGTGPERIAERLRLFEQQGLDAFRRDILESQLERSRQGQPVSPVAIAQSYNALGENQKALDWLEKAYEARTFQILWLKTWPAWDSLRGEPRYHELLRKMRLEQ